jgi:PAS domain S-box-containing protein
LGEGAENVTATDSQDKGSIVARVAAALHRLGGLRQRIASDSVPPPRELTDIVDGLEATLQEVQGVAQGLQESVLRARAVVDSAVDGMITIDDRGVIESFNPGATRLFGYAAEEVIGHNVSMLMPEPHRSQHPGYIRRYLQTGEKRVIGVGRELEGQHKNGTVFPIELTLSEAQVGDRPAFTGLVRDVTERRRFQEAVRQERDFAERLLEAAQAIVLVLDRQGRIVRFNQYTEELTGYRLADVRGQDWFSIFLPERQRERVRALFGSASAGTHVDGNVNAVRTADGSEREIEWQGRPLRDAQGEVVGVLSIGLDVTERRRRERHTVAQLGVTRALADSTSLQEATPRVLRAICKGFDWDLGELWHVDTNLGGLRLDGMWHVAELDAAEFEALTRDMVVAAPDDLPGRVWAGSETIWVSDLDARSRSGRRPAAARLGLRSAVAFPCRRGGTVTGVMAFFSRAVRESDAEVMSMLDSLGRQIGDFIGRKRIEERLLQLAAVVEASNDAIVGVTMDGNIMGWNRGAEKVYGYSAAEVLGCALSVLIPEERREEWPAVLRRVARGDVVDHYETQSVRKDGMRVDVSLTVSPIRDVAGTIVGVSSIARDITERRRAEAELQDLQKLAQQRQRLADIGAITAKLAHDLGNPLAAVSMQAQLILRRARRAKEQPVGTVLGPAEQIVHEVGRLDALIRDVMTFSREQRLELKTVAVTSFLQEVVSLWRPVAAQRRIRLKVDIPDDAGTLRADEEKLHRVFDNLLKNAVEAIDTAPGEVRVSVDLPSREKIRISVEDTGSGIPETLEVFRLFETTKTEGTGLGLAIAKQIIVAHGGEIEFARLDSHGTVFHVELPRDGPPV